MKHRLCVIAVGVGLLAGCGAGSGATPAPLQPSHHDQDATAGPSKTVPAVLSSPEDPLAGDPLIATATWTVNSKGRQLRVVPTAAGRTDQFPAASARAWAEILAKAPDAGTPGMHDQFRCHWDFARVVEPDKPSWDLEPWRPAVGYDKTVDALCNPGGAEN